MLNFAFFGTSSFAATVLDELKAAGFVPSLIITVPDAPVGRKRVLTPPPVKLWAEANNVPVEQPPSLKKFSSSQFPVPNSQFDLFLVVDYGKLIPQSLLDIPKHGSLNIHVSLLPKFRGPSPMQSTLLAGEDKTGVTIMEVVAGLDEGNIVAEEVFDLTTWHPTHNELRDRSAHAGGKLLAKILPDYVAGRIKTREQDHSLATYTKKFTSEDGYIEPEIVLGKKVGDEAKEAERKVRALNPDPGTWSSLSLSKERAGVRSVEEVRIKILSAHLDQEKFIPDQVHPAGKKEMSWQDFLRGNKVIV